MSQLRKITITTTRILRYQAPAVRAVCPVCAREVVTLDAAQAAAVLEVSQPQFQQLLAAATVHAITTVSGSLRICQDSLFQ